MSILTTFMLLLLTTFTVCQHRRPVIARIGLGVADRYSSLGAEERAHGRSNEDAVVVAMKTAGCSPLAVAISLLALVVIPVPA